MSYQVKCLQCHEYFAASRSNAKTCSPACRKQCSRSHPKIKNSVPTEPTIKHEAVPLEKSYADEQGMLHLTESDFNGLFAGTFDERSLLKKPDPDLAALEQELHL
jgi:hypothetical protein